MPVGLDHYETYVFTQWDNTPSGGSTVPGMRNAFGFGDTEIGVKYRFVPESATRPQIGFFPMAEVATGDAARNLGNGQTWYRLPMWVQKSYDDGKWTVDTGGGVALNAAPGQRNYGFGGLLLQRSLGTGLTLGAEVYTQGSTAVGTTPTTFYNVGAYVNPSSQFSILVSLGHSVAGQSHAIGYFALYYTFPQPSK